MLPHQRPVIMTSYGGFGVPMTPQFSVLVCIMMELGAVFALPHIAVVASSEINGTKPLADGIVKWRLTTSSPQKMLCSNGATTSDKLAIFGGSNSGLLVA